MSYHDFKVCECDACNERYDRHAAYLARMTSWQRFRRWMWLYREANWLMAALIALVVFLTWRAL